MTEALLTKPKPAPNLLGKFTRLDEKVSSNPEKVSAEAAGYMELVGAKKDGSCKVVQVEGGVSKDLGCSNLFSPIKGAKIFSCGTCEYFVPSGDSGKQGHSL